ncbi:hypothetical protein A5M85_03430 [Cellulophaga lytica]|nr:hypothetical protein A5M85_03430 [Cellulophaga lytica]
MLIFKSKKMKKILVIATMLAISASCSDDYLESDLENIVTDETISELAEESPEALLSTASSFDTGTINNMRTFNVAGSGGNHNDYGQKSIDLMMDIMSNDMIDSNNGWWYDDLYKYIGRTQESGTETNTIWDYYYEIIKGANQTITLIGGLDESVLTQDLTYVLSRSKVVRGLAYLQLIQIYQKGNPAMSDAGVPIIDPTADLVNGPGFGRLTVQDVYDQIESDLKEGYDGLEGFSRPDKTVINQNIAAGYLARFYLLSKDYTKAIQFAEIAKSAGSLAADQLLDGFQYISNPEWLWGADINGDTSSIYASFFAQMQSYSPVQKSAIGVTPGYTGQLGHHRTVDVRLYNAVASTDVRSNWFGPDNGFIDQPKEGQIYNYKFYDDTFFEADYVYMRVAEMYLIIAEAKASSGDDAGAAQELFDLVSTRDNAYIRSTNSGSSLMEEIKLHRRIELWGEGFGLLDMKRWDVGLVRDFEGTTHPNSPSSFFNIPAGDARFTFQIPETEINLNDAITPADQNQ